MKLLFSQFKFVVKSRRFQKSIWTKYYELRKKDKLNDNDKFYLRQVREALKPSEVEVTVIHRPTRVSLTTIVNSAKMPGQTFKIPYRDLMNKVIMKVKETRKNGRKIKSVTKQFDGANYTIVGGILEKPNLINEIAKHTKTNDPFSNKQPRHKHKNYIGIELEFNQLPAITQNHIAEGLKNAGLAKYINVTTDASCGWEVRVLLPEDDFIEPLTKIMKIIKEMGHTVDNRCGTHVHFDMRNRDVKLVYENLFKSQRFLRKFISKSRKNNNRYCQMNKAETFDKQLSLGDRYYSLNVQSYRRHKTLEVRMHQGTLNPSELVPWIKLLLKIVNYNSSIPSRVNTLKQARKQFDIDETLSKNLEERIITVFRPGLIPGIGG